MAAAARGRSVLKGLAPGEDVASTRRCLKGYRLDLLQGNGQVEVQSEGLASWSEPGSALDCGNSGTTMRVLAGLAARLPFRSVLDGDASLRRRPMDRIVAPLRALGAAVEARDDRLPPIEIVGGELTGAEIRTGVPSAQVKSCVILAGLGASGKTVVIEPIATRDHTERMLSALGAPLHVQRVEDGGSRVELEAFDLPAFTLELPGDASSAAFLVAAGLLAGEVRIDDVLLNPTRTGLLETLSKMGADVRWETAEERVGEPVGWVEARRSALTGIDLPGGLVPSMIDELPVLAVLATQAAGETTVRGAEELRVKESDRIAALTDGLGRLGARIHATQDGFVASGPTPLYGAEVDAWGDHRIAMALAVAGLACDGETRVKGWEAAAVSWPGFERALARLGADVALETP